MELQGWKTEAMFRRYGIVALSDKADALQKLESYERQQVQNRDNRQENTQFGPEN
jgi:hypothetical protein